MGRYILEKRSLSFSEKIEDKVEDDRKHILHNGTCGVGVCGEEKACQSFKNNTYTCICTHDSKPPTADGTCPRRLVPVQPGKSGKIPNVQPPILSTPSKDITSYLNSNSTPIDNSREMISVFNYNSPIFIISIISILAIFFCTYITFIFRRKYSQNHNAASPVNLKNSLLVAERYAPNPQYSACSGAGVLVLRKETLKFLNEIGEGCFGKVYKGELLCEESDKIDIVAIKVLKESATREAEEDFLREVEIMSAFRHPNILSLLGVVLREGVVSPMMVFEFMPLGDLAELLRSQRKTLNDDNVPELSGKDLLSIALQIANGMKYLAAQRFVHRDLACRNCLVAEGPIVKIADFGMSRDVYTCDYYKIGGSRLLPVRWMSPESVVYGRFTLESDIWSYGVVLWEIYSFGKQPYYGHTNEEVVKLILDNIMLIPPEDCPSLICELMKNCWKSEPRHRITFPNICDKLELAFENYIEKPSKLDTCLKYENKMRKFSTKSLPRPPPLPVLSVNLGTEDLLDGEGYLLPKEIKEPVQYLQTLPD